MKIIYLAGNSLRNKEWIESLAKFFKMKKAEGIVQYYNHWETGKETIDFDYEQNMLTEQAKNEKDYFIIAKSVGSTLALKSIYKKIIAPKGCIFMGLNTYSLKENAPELFSNLSSYKTPTTFIQNDNDPYGSSESLKEALSKNKSKKILIEVWKSSTHDYPNFERIFEIFSMMNKN